MTWSDPLFEEYRCRFSTVPFYIRKLIPFNCGSLWNWLAVLCRFIKEIERIVFKTEKRRYKTNVEDALKEDHWKLGWQAFKIFILSNWVNFIINDTTFNSKKFPFFDFKILFMFKSAFKFYFCKYQILLNMNNLYISLEASD